jgi:hypothetical protein
MALTGNDDGFKYDIAFSFVREDEGLATQLNDRVRDRYRTFLYPRAQEQLAGTDGERHSMLSSARKPESLPCCCDLNGDILRGLGLRTPQYGIGRTTKDTISRRLS